MNSLTRGNAKIGKLNLRGALTAKDIITLSATFVVGTEAANAINVAVQLKDGAGVNVAERKVLQWYLATNATGATPAGTAPTGKVAAGAAGALIESINNLSGMAVTNATGQLDVTLTDTGTPTFYLVLVLPNGSLAVSPAITFA